MRTGIYNLLKAKESERENSNELGKTKQYYALADIVSVAKIKIMYASAQHAHSEPGI